MPLYEFQCDAEDTCAHVFETLLRMSERELPKSCPKCQGPTHRIMLPSGLNADACNIDPVVVFKNADGSYAFPGRNNRAAGPGQERIELRSIMQIDKFEREVNAQYGGMIRQRVDREQARYEAVETVRRARLRHAIQHGFTMKDSNGNTVSFGAFSELGRRFAEAAMSRSVKRREYDANFRVEILHMNQSNREPWRDVDTGWRKVRR